MKNTVFNVILLCAALTACETQSHHIETKSKYNVIHPIRTDTLITRNYVAQVHSHRHIELRAVERGYLEKIYVDEGQFVKKGQLLFQIMPRIYQAELKRAEAELSYAQIEYENTKRLAENKVVAANELALAEAQLDKAKAELALAQVHLDFTQIRAPFSGIINLLHVRLGSLVEEGELLTSLSDNSQMWVYFNLPEAEYLDYMTNNQQNSEMHVRLKMANNQLFKHPGKLTAIEGEFNNETGNIAFRATFPNKEGLLRHGETGTILVDVPLQNTVLIPQQSTFEILDKKFVYVVDGEVLKSQEVKIGAELPQLYSIEKGLTQNDIILFDGLRKVKEGDQIEHVLLDKDIALSKLKFHAE